MRRMANADVESASDLSLDVSVRFKLSVNSWVGDTGLEPVTSSVSGKRATRLRQSPVLCCCAASAEAGAGIEPAYRALQALA